MQLRDDNKLLLRRLDASSEGKFILYIERRKGINAIERRLSHEQGTPQPRNIYRVWLLKKKNFKFCGLRLCLNTACNNYNIVSRKKCIGMALKKKYFKLCGGRLCLNTAWHNYNIVSRKKSISARFDSSPEHMPDDLSNRTL
jgi:hypothetical protein